MDISINKILEEICKPGSIYDIILEKNLSTNNHLKPELISELAISFLEKPEEIIKSYKEGWFRYKFSRAVTNQIQSKTSPFHRQVRMTLNDRLKSDKSPIEWLDNILVDETYEQSELADYVEYINQKKRKAIAETKMTWYESEIVKMYFEQGYSTRQIEKIDGIDHVSVWKTIKAYKNKVKKNYDENKS